MKSSRLFALVFGFLCGVFIRSIAPVSNIFLGLSGIILLAILGFRAVEKRDAKASAYAALLFVSFCFGVARFGISDYDPSKDLLAKNLDGKSSIKGIIIDEPDVRENNTKLTIHPEEIIDTAIDTHEKILATVPKYPEFVYGDEVELSGALARPENFMTDANKEFDYVSYLAKDDIRYVMFMPKASFVSSGHGNRIKAALFDVKNAFMSRIQSVIPSPESSLLGGLIVGAKASLGQELMDDFRKAGLVHIVVLSGYNVSIVAVALMRALTFLPRMIGVSFGAVSIILFALMTGASATTVRASIMALLMILTKITGRAYDITRALLIAGFFMVLQNPRILVFDISFQLSFLATLALIYVSPIIEPCLQWVTEKWGMRGIVSATLASQIFVSPFILYSMGNFSVVALATNLLVLPFIPLTMLFGFLAGCAAFLSPVIALPFAFIAKILLSYELSVVRIFSHIPFASLTISYFPFALMLAIYAFYAWYIVKHSKKSA